MSETKVSLVLFKHAFFGGGHVITETVAGICTLIIALLVIFLGNLLFFLRGGCCYGSDGCIED